MTANGVRSPDPLAAWPDFAEAVRLRLEQRQPLAGLARLTLFDALVDVCASAYVLTARGDEQQERLDVGERAPLLTAEQAAKRLALPKARVYELARTGRLPGTVRIEGQVRFDCDVLEEWIARGGETRPRGPGAPG